MTKQTKLKIPGNKLFFKIFYKMCHKLFTAEVMFDNGMNTASKKLANIQIVKLVNKQVLITVSKLSSFHSPVFVLITF